MSNDEHLKYAVSLGKRIEDERIKKKLSVREFALIADIEHHQLINIEKGRIDMRLSTLLKIAAAFDKSLGELLMQPPI